MEKKEALESRDKEALEYFKIPSLHQNSFTEISLFGGERGGEGKVVKINVITAQLLFLPSPTDPMNHTTKV